MIVIRGKPSDGKEIGLLSDYVIIYNDGYCAWLRRFDLSVSHCNVDVRWFPFDVQRCELIFTAWRIDEYETTNITVLDELLHDYTSIYAPSEEWDLTCAYGGPPSHHLLTTV